MPRKLSRAEREAILTQYELPGFAAGKVIHRLDHVLELLVACAKLYGNNAYLEKMDDQIRIAIDETREWQIRAQEACNYPYRRKD